MSAAESGPKEAVPPEWVNLTGPPLDPGDDGSARPSPERG